MTKASASAHSFATYALASPAERSALVPTIGEPIDPRRDFYRPIRGAVCRDRRTLRDGSGVRAVVNDSPRSRRVPYTRIQLSYDDVRPRWAISSSIPAPRCHLDLPGLRIGTRPTFAETWDDGTDELVFARFDYGPAPRELIDIVLRVAQRGIESRGALATVTFLDLGGASTHSSVGRDLDSIDELIDGTASELAERLRGR